MAKALILKELLNSLGLTTAEFEAAIKVGNDTIGKQIRTDGNLSSNIISKIIEAYPGVNSTWLYEGKGPMFSDEYHVVENRLELKDDVNQYVIKRKQGKNTVDLSTPTYGIQSVDIQHIDPKTKSLNMQYFLELLPTDRRRNGWLPVYANLALIIDYFVQTIDQDKSLSKFPLEPTPSDYVRLSHTTADLIFTYYSKNMEPSIVSGAQVAIKFLDIDDYTPGEKYLVAFNDFRYFIFTVDAGKDEEHISVRSMSTATVKQYRKDKIMFIGEVKSIANPA